MEWYIPWWFQYTQYRRRQWTSIYLFLLFFHITRGNFTSRDTRRLTWEMKIMSVSSSSISLYSCFLFALPQRLKTLLIIPISSISNCQSNINKNYSWRAKKVLYLFRNLKSVILLPIPVFVLSLKDYLLCLWRFEMKRSIMHSRLLNYYILTQK